MNKKLRELFAKRSTIATEMRSLMDSNKIDEAEALDSLAMYREIIDAMNEEDRLEVLLESGECPNGGA